MNAKDPVVSTSASNEQSGWRRIRNIYKWGSVSMEKDICQAMGAASFMAGALAGGLMRQKEAMSRFETYSTGKMMGSRRNLARRRMDYVITMFIRNGFRAGVRMALLFTPVIVATTHLAAYKGRFSPFTAPIAMITCGCAYGLPLGIPGVVRAFRISLLPGFLATIAPFCYRWCYELDSVDSAYWHFKRNYEDEIIFAKRVEEFKKKEGIFFSFLAKSRLREMDRLAKENEEDEKYSD